MWWVVLLMVWGSAQAPAIAAARPQPPQEIRALAIQHNGRHKPFDSFAREVLLQITGAPRVGRQDPVWTVLAIIADPERWQAEPLVSVPFVPLREALGVDRKTSRMSYQDLVGTRTLMRLLPPIVQKQQRDEKLTMLEQETMDVFGRFVALSDLFEQKLELVPPPAGSSNLSWLPIFEPAGYAADQQTAFRNAWTAFIETVRSNDEEAMAVAAHRLADTLRVAQPSAYPAPWRLRFEVFYNQFRPFAVARLAYLVALVCWLIGLGGSRPAAGRLGTAMLALAFGIHGAGMAARVILGGRPPVSNFYETMLWLPFVAVALALVFGRLYRTPYFGIAASLLAALVLWLAAYVPLDPSITPVVAVLRSNLWLTIHVLTIVASYGALALATILAHFYGWLYVFRGSRHAALSSLGLFLYRTIQVGVVLLAGGVMLGAVWANASWGRYWGWDPKETWALITLLWFLAILHGRFAGWLKEIGVAVATIGGFFLLLMTYYGVSFYLVGLHSYAGGHAKPLPSLLIAYLIAEAAFVAVVSLKAMSLKSTASGLSRPS